MQEERNTTGRDKKEKDRGRRNRKKSLKSIAIQHFTRCPKQE